MLVSLAAAALATPPAVFGVALRPLGRADLTWVAQGNTTGVSVGPLDGFVAPTLQAYAGVGLDPRLDLLGTLGVARLQNTIAVGDVVTQRHWGVVRPGVDARIRLRQGRGPIPFALAGVHVAIPSARDVSSGYTDEEQAAADALIARERRRLGAIGARLGAGATLAVIPGLAVGLQYTVDVQRSWFRGNDPLAVTSFVVGEAALLLELRWPPPPPPSLPEAPG